jgi:septum site-determining protein MinD
MAKIISVHSYRGGTGKSNLTSNIAAIIARHGYRVGIVDTDIQSPGIHVLFGFDETRINLALNDYIWGNTAIENTAYDVTSVLNNKGTEKSKLYLVPSSVKVNDIARVLREGYNVEMLNQGFQNLIEKLDLDYLLIDTHPGLNEETLLSIAMSDIFVLILRPDQQDYQGSAVTLDVAKRLEVPKMLLVVNKVPQSLNLVQLREKVREAYSTEVAGMLPHSEELMTLASNGIFALQYPEHELSLVLEEIATKVIR